MDARVKEGLASSCLLKVEMARVAHRDHFDVRVVDEFIVGVELIEIDPDVIERASALTGELKPLDAIHLATATLLDAPRHPVTVLTHDARLAGAARARRGARPRGDAGRGRAGHPGGAAVQPQ